MFTWLDQTKNVSFSFVKLILIKYHWKKLTAVNNIYSTIVAAKLANWCNCENDKETTWSKKKASSFTIKILMYDFNKSLIENRLLGNCFHNNG